MRKPIVTLMLGALLVCTEAWAQTNAIKGTVLGGDTDEALPGVTVRVQGGSGGTTTDIDGNYKIEAGPNAVLSFSYVGYQTQAVAVGGRSQISVTLLPDVTSLAEVVVVGYGTTTENNLTTSVVSLDEEVIQDKPFVSVEQSINGKAPGVQVLQSSGQPGGGISLRIRGATSITGGNEPLYVVDGVPVLNTEGLNPNDVASIEILKDAAASSIYGARAANGVVLITTKRGSKANPQFQFSTYAGLDQVARTLPVLNSEQFMSYLNEARANAGLSPVAEPFDFQHNTDWQRELYQPATIQNYQASFSGGSETGSFFMSAGYQNQEGVIAPSAFERFSVRINQDRELLNWLKVGNSVALSRTNFNSVNDNQRVNQGGVVLSALTTPPTIPVQNEDGTYPLNPYQAWENPVALVRGEDRTSFTNKVLANVYGEVALPADLVFKTSFGVDYYNSKSDRFIDPFTTGNGRALQGEASNSTYNELIWLWENTLSWNRTFGDGHNVEALAGTTTQRSRWESTFLMGRGFVNGTVPTAAAASEPISIDAQIAEWALLSQFVRTSYNYQGRYLITASVRRDGSSRFGSGNKYGIFPSVSAAWNVSDESFLDQAAWLQHLKLRYSWGVTGNQNIGNYNAFGTYGPGANYPLNGAIFAGIYPGQVDNQNLRWETTAQHNLGLDFSVLDSRVGMTLDAYYKRTTDMLLFSQLPSTSGYSGSLQNIGALENRGLEFGLEAAPVRTTDLRWNTQANLSLNRARVLEIGAEPIVGGFVNDQGNVAILQEGESPGNFYGWVMEGINSETGNVMFRDLDENGVINDQDRQIIGNALPDFIYGFTNSVGYKGLELVVFFQGVEGQDIYNATRFELESMSTFKNQSTTVLDRWTPDNTDGTLPIAVFGDPADNDRVSTRWIEDGSYLKLREVSLSYTVPQSLASRLLMQSAKVYVQGRNLYTFTDYTGYDPEVSRDGGSTISPNIDYGTYPQVRSLLVGLSITF